MIGRWSGQAKPLEEDGHRMIVDRSTTAIVVDSTADVPEWLAIRDRLQRATRPASD